MANKILRKIRYILVVIIFIVFTGEGFANNTLDEINAISKIRDTTNANNAEKSLHSTESISTNALGTNYAFVYFYRASCPHCQRFSPILQQYSAVEHITVKAFTFDGVSSSSFPQSAVVSRDMVQEYFGGDTIAVPALFIMNTDNMHVYPVASGELSYAELQERMNALTPKILQAESGAQT